MRWAHREACEVVPASLLVQSLLQLYTLAFDRSSYSKVQREMEQLREKQAGRCQVRGHCAHVLEVAEIDEW